MTVLWRAVALICAAGPLAAQDIWVYAAPEMDDLRAIGGLERIEITTEDATVAVAWLPEDQAWRMFVVHNGWDPDPTRRIMAVYADQQIEILSVDAVLAERMESGATDLRFDIPESFLKHLGSAETLNVSRASGPVEIPLDGSSTALEALADARLLADEAQAAQIAAARETAFACDVLTAWEGDSARIAPAVAWETLEPEAAMRACFVASQDLPDDMRYVFQLGRATAKAGLAGGTVWIRQAAAGGYQAAAEYLAAPEG